MKKFKKIINKIRKKPYEELDSGNPYEKPKAGIKEFFVNLGVIRTVAWGVLFFLTFADILTMNDLFTGAEFDLDKIFAGIIAFTCALFLEGVAYILGDGLNRLLDKKKRSKKNDRKKTWLWFILGLISSVVIMVALIAFRIEVVLLSVGDSDKLQLVEILLSASPLSDKIRDIYMLLTFGSEDSDEIAANIYLAVQPILTTILAFLISFAYLSDDSDARNRQIERNYRKKLQRAKLNCAANNRILQRAKLDLLSDLGIDSENEKWTNCSNDEFIRKVFHAMTTKVNKMAINGHVIAVNNYNSAVKSKLEEYLHVIAAKSNLPDRITSISVESIMDIFDSRNKDIEKWNADAYVEKSSEILKSVLFNEMIVKFTIVDSDDFLVNEKNTAVNDSMPKKDVFHPGQSITGSDLEEMRELIIEEDDEEVEMYNENTVIPGAGYSEDEADDSGEESSAPSESTYEAKPDLSGEDYPAEYEAVLPDHEDTDANNENALSEYDGVLPEINPEEPAASGYAYSQPADEDGPMEYDGKL